MAYLVHISDTHIGPTEDFTLYGVEPFPCLKRLVDGINGLPFLPDLVIHSGDVVAAPDPDAYRLAGDELARLKAPVYYATGNHDTSGDIQRFLPMGSKVDLVDGDQSLTYRISLKNHNIIVLDGRGRDEIDPAGELEEEQFVILKREIQQSELPVSVFLHFPPIELDSPWLDRDMLLLNGARLHQVLSDGRSKLRGVFFGHVHRSLQIYKEGILYSGVGSPFCQFTAWPNDEKPGFEIGCPVFFNFISFLSDRTIVKEHFV